MALDGRAGLGGETPCGIVTPAGQVGEGRLWMERTPADTGPRYLIDIAVVSTYNSINVTHTVAPQPFITRLRYIALFRSSLSTC